MTRKILIAALSFGLFSAMATAAYPSGALLSTPVKGEYVYETHMPSMAAAVDKAQAFCRGKYGGGCSVLKTWDHGCVAVAHSDTTNHSGWSVTSSMGESMGKARTRCETYGTPCSFAATFERNNCE